MSTTPPGGPAAQARQAADRDAKHPRSALAGPYGHPFHPIAVTIPIGAWSASIVFDLLALLGSDEATFAVGSQWLLGIGIVGALVAALLGILDLGTIPRDTRAFRTAISHMLLNTVAITLFTVSLVVRLAADDDGVPTSAFLLSLVAFALLGASGWLGGKLSYRYGVRVADEGTQAEGFRG